MSYDHAVYCARQGDTTDEQAFYDLLNDQEAARKQKADLDYVECGDARYAILLTAQALSWADWDLNLSIHARQGDAIYFGSHDEADEALNKALDADLKIVSGDLWIVRDGHRKLYGAWSLPQPA